MPDPYLFFIRCLALAAIKFKKERMVIHDLFCKFSYRYTRVELNSFLSPLRYLKAALALLFVGHKDGLPASAKYVTYDGKESSRHARLNYLSYIGYPASVFIARDRLINHLSMPRKLLAVIQLGIIFVIILPVALFSRDKAKASLILLELTEALLLANALKKLGCGQLLILSASEKDIVFLCHFLQQKLHVKVSLQPSFNPIHFYYQRVICDTFIFTAPFQKYEFAQLSKNWFYKDTQLWPPFGCDAIKLNPAPGNVPGSFTVGLTSSCSALREHLAHTNSTNNEDYLAEFALIDALKRLQEEKHLDKIVVFFHPLEKANAANLEFSEAYYKNIFSNVEFAPFDIPSKQSFDLCSVSVSGFSSAQIERLYGGYKTLFAPMGYLKNYFSDPRLDGISVQSYEGLKAMIEKCRNLSDDSFFKEYNLLDYRWDAFPAITFN